MSTEQYICMNCLSVMELNQNGRCSVCSSDSVLSRELVQGAVSKQEGSKPENRYTTKDTTIYGYLVTHKSGFHCFVQNPNRALVYNESQDALTRWYHPPQNSEPNDLEYKPMTRNEWVSFIKERA